jgi:hypothetical protein
MNFKLNVLHVLYYVQLSCAMLQREKHEGRYEFLNKADDDQN